MFILHSTDDDRQLPTEYLPCSAIRPRYGMAMYLTGGQLAIASAANAATHICVREEGEKVEAGTVVPVVKIQQDQVWETDGTSDMVVGTGYDVASDGLSIKKTSTGAAHFYVMAVEGTTVRGRFGAVKTS